MDVNQENTRTPPRPSSPAPEAVASVPLGEALRFWFKLGFISFGGPAGQIAIMHRTLVEENAGSPSAAFCTR